MVGFVNIVVFYVGKNCIKTCCSSLKNIMYSLSSYILESWILKYLCLNGFVGKGTTVILVGANCKFSVFAVCITYVNLYISFLLHATHHILEIVLVDSLVLF